MVLHHIFLPNHFKSSSDKTTVIRPFKSRAHPPTTQGSSSRDDVSSWVMLSSGPTVLKNIVFVASWPQYHSYRVLTVYGCIFRRLTPNNFPTRLVRLDFMSALTPQIYCVSPVTIIEISKIFEKKKNFCVSRHERNNKISSKTFLHIFSETRLFLLMFLWSSQGWRSHNNFDTLSMLFVHTSTTICHEEYQSSLFSSTSHIYFFWCARHFFVFYSPKWLHHVVLREHSPCKL